jgi:GTP-binding protein LepA
VADVQIGDTITESARPWNRFGLSEIKPMVFAGLYPVDTNQYEELRDALDHSVERRVIFLNAESSTALGWLSLRFPGPAAHGDRAGTSGADSISD